MKKFIAWVAIILGVLLTGIMIVLKMLVDMSDRGIDPATIGIIGGADGPTAIIVTGNFDGGSWMILIGGILLTVLGIIWLIRNKRKKS